jgi:hypothetical protein
VTGVVVSDGDVRIVSVGIQGPQGPQGPAGGNSGITISATPPPTPALSDQWLDTSASPDQLNIWNGVAWEEFVYKSELADGNGQLDINAGYF